MPHPGFPLPGAAQAACRYAVVLEGAKDELPVALISE